MIFMIGLVDSHHRVEASERPLNAHVGAAGVVVGGGCSSHKDSIPPFRICFCFVVPGFVFGRQESVRETAAGVSEDQVATPFLPERIRPAPGVHTLTGDKTARFFAVPVSCGIFYCWGMPVARHLD